MRLLEQPQEYNFEIEYLLGAQNYIQNALSPRCDYQHPQDQLASCATGPKAMDEANLLHPNSGMSGYQVGSITPTTSIINLFTTIVVGADECLEEIRSGYEQDPYFAEVLISLKDQMPHSNRVNGSSQEVESKEGSSVRSKERTSAESLVSSQRIKARQRHYRLEADGLITNNRSGLLCIPNAGDLRQQIMSEAHDTPIGGHFGIQHTTSALARQFF